MHKLREWLTTLGKCRRYLYPIAPTMVEVRANGPYQMLFPANTTPHKPDRATKNKVVQIHAPDS